MVTRAQAQGYWGPDYRWHDGMEEVTLTDIAGNNTAAVQAKLELPDTKLQEGQNDTAPPITTALWVLWDATMGGAQPAEGWKITEAGGTVWHIVSATRELWDTQWHCMTTRHA